MTKACDQFEGRFPMKGISTGIYAEKEDGQIKPTPLGIGTVTFMMIAFLGVATFAIKVVQDMRRDAAAVERFAEELKNAGVAKVWKLSVTWIIWTGPSRGTLMDLMGLDRGNEVSKETLP